VRRYHPHLLAKNARSASARDCRAPPPPCGSLGGGGGGGGGWGGDASCAAGLGELFAQRAPPIEFINDMAVPTPSSLVCARAERPAFRHLLEGHAGRVPGPPVMPRDSVRDHLRSAPEILKTVFLQWRSAGEPIGRTVSRPPRRCTETMRIFVPSESEGGSIPTPHHPARCAALFSRESTRARWRNPRDGNAGSAGRSLFVSP